MKFINFIVVAIVTVYSAFLSVTVNCNWDGPKIGRELGLVGAVIASWSLLPLAIAANSGAGKAANKSEGNNGKPVKKSVIDELLEKAEAARADTKEKAHNQATSVDRGELDPVKCFPKALCGVSSEVEQISKRKKSGLISEYLILMKALAKHPEFLEDVVSTSTKNKGATTKNGKKSKNQKDVPNNDASDSEEDDEDNESDEEEDEEDKNDDVEVSPIVPKNDDYQFNKAYLKEKLEMEKLMEETIMKEKLEKQWWHEPSSPSNRPWSGGRPNLGAIKPWGYGSGGGYDRPGPPSPPPRRRRPGFRPFFRGDKPEGSIQPQSDSYTASGSGITGGVTSFFTNLFGFGETSLTNDPWFASAARDLSGEVAPGVAVDETREMLETAIDIGGSFDKPTQCNEIFNACQYDYTELLYMIDDLRKNVRESVRESEKSKGKKESTNTDQSPKKKKKKKEGKKNKAKSEISTKTASQMKNTDGRRKKYKLTADGSSGEDPEERYVIPIVPPPSTSFADSFSFPNVLSWLGM